MSGIDSLWLDQQVKAYAQRRGDYQRHSQLLAAVLRWIVNPVCPTAYVATRTKTVASFAGKILRRAAANGKPDDDRPQYERTPDLSAGRIVVHLRRQVTLLEPKVLEVFNKTFERRAERELDEDQFGYRAIHFIGTLRLERLRERGFFDSPPAADLPPLDGLESILCEIQLVTLAQNLWTEFVHDRQYKGAFQFPRALARMTFRVAAEMEGVDDTLAEIDQELSRLETNVGPYLEPEQARQELEKLEAIFRWSPDDAALLQRIVRLMIQLGMYGKVIDRLDANGAKLTPRLKSELGFACCSTDAPRQDKPRGLALLRESAKEHPDVETMTRIARFDDEDDLARRENWRNAYLACQTDPTALAGFLRYEMAFTHTDSIANLLAPNIEQACQTLRQQIDLRINLPVALYLLAEFDLVRRRPYDALYRICQAISMTPRTKYGNELIAYALKQIRKLREVAPEPEGLVWVEWTIALLQAVREADGGRVEVPEHLLPLAGAPIKGPVVIVAGGCDDAGALDWPRYARLLDFALADFDGTLASGGTRSGVSEVVGDVIEKDPSRRTGFAWLPPVMSPMTALDTRYADLRACGENTYEAADFSAYEPLRVWITILASGIRPADVKLIGINGGRIAAFEYHLAAAMNAQVALVRGSGRAVNELLSAQDQPGNDRIRFLPADPETFRAFVAHPERSGFSDEEVKAIAEQVDLTYHDTVHRQTRDAWDRTIAGDPTLARAFAASNVAQVESIQAKLARIGLKAVKIESDATPSSVALTGAQVEALAAMEHGRWVVERTLAGWRLGPHDNEAKTRPQLLAWDDPALSEEERDKDRAAVRAIPAILERVGYVVVRDESHRKHAS